MKFNISTFFWLFVFSFGMSALVLSIFFLIFFPHISMKLGLGIILISAFIMTLIMFNLDSINKILHLERRCQVCQKVTKDRFWVGKKKFNYCRNHLAEKFEENFKSSNAKIVILYPNLEGKGKGSGLHIYRFFNIKECDDKEFVIKNLEKIKGKCEKCGFIASVAYFDKNILKYQKDSIGLESPDFKSMNDNPQILCKNCVSSNLSWSLKQYKKDFEEPIILPDENDKEGAMYSLEL